MYPFCLLPYPAVFRKKAFRHGFIQAGANKIRHGEMDQDEKYREAVDKIASNISYEEPKRVGDRPWFTRVLGTKGQALKTMLFFGIVLLMTAGRAEDVSAWQMLAGIFLLIPPFCMLDAK